MNDDDKKEEVHTAKIIPFPAERIVRIREIADAEKSLHDTKVDYIHRTTERLVSALVNSVAAEGIGIHREEMVADTILIFESVKAAIYRWYEMDHPLHEFTDENFAPYVRGVVSDAAEHDGDDDGAPA